MKTKLFITMLSFYAFANAPEAGAQTNVCPASFTLTQNGYSVTVTNTSTGPYTTVRWLFDPSGVWVPTTTNPYTHTYSQAGTYYLMLRKINNCLFAKDIFA